jgi:transcriptional antiterminator
VQSFKEFLVESALLDKKTLTPKQLAEKHGVSLKSILKQLAMGIKVELEHTTKRSVARKIALAHLGEHADYYTRLKKAKL